MTANNTAKSLFTGNYRHDSLLRTLIQKLALNPFYKEKFTALGIHPSDIKGIEDLPKLPFTTKEDLRRNYPLGLQIAPDKDIVRVHSSGLK